METTERVVEAYVRYIRNWFTLPNIRCDGQFEIDLLAIDPLNGDRYHIESGVSISGSYSQLTDRPFSDEDLKIRNKTAGQRRTLGYFVERKFGHPRVIAKLADYGFLPGKYRKVIVSWSWSEAAERRAADHEVELWDFRSLLAEISNKFSERRTYFTDDTLRTLHLFALANDTA